jgi:hypothetical protein
MAETDLAKLVVKMEAQSAKYLRDLQKARQESNKWRKKTVSNVNAVGVSFRKLAAAASIGLLTKKIIGNTRTQEQALAQLRQGYESTGGVVGRTVDEMVMKAGELQKVSLFGDEQIIEAQSQLITFTNVVDEQFDRATVAALDLSTRMGTDLKSAVLQLGKVLNEPASQLSALSRSGIQFNDQQTEMIRKLTKSGDLVAAQNIVLEELERQFGGSAKAARETFGGALTGLSNAFGDLLEGKGGNGKGMEGARLEIEKLTAVLQDPEFVDAINSSIGLMVRYFTLMLSLGPKLTAMIGNLATKMQSVVDPNGNLAAIFNSDILGNKPSGGGDRGNASANNRITITRGNDQIDATSPDFLNSIGVGGDSLDGQLKKDIEYFAARNEEAKKSAEIQKRIEQDILATKFSVASQALDLVASTAKEGSALQKAAFIGSRALAAAQAVINAELAATAALAPPPIGLGPVAGGPLAATVRALGYASAGLIAAQAVASFDGGGYTGNGPRSGGIDGKGGFLAVMHPRETVTDHTKGGAAPQINQFNDFRGSSLSEGRVQEMITQANLNLEYKIKKDLSRR